MQRASSRVSWPLVGLVAYIGASFAPALTSFSCAGFPGVGAHRTTDQIPPDVRARLFGRWICGSELPQGRPSSRFELLRHLAPGKAWELVVDEDGLAALQVVGRHGRARQGCWTELTPGELTILERTTRDSAICERPDDPRGAEPHNAFDLDVHITGATCTKHFAATPLLRAPQGQRFAEGTRHLMDDIAGGSFRRMEELVTSAAPAEQRARAGAPLPANVVAVSERLSCTKVPQTIYEFGDAWLLHYSFQKGLLWRRDLEVSARGAVGLDFASLQNEAKYSCTGQLTADELEDLRGMLGSTHPCTFTGAEPRGRDDHATISLNQPGADCRYHTLRQQDLRSSWSGRRFDGLMASLVSRLAGSGGVDPFDAQRGLLVEKRAPARGGRAEPAR